MMNWSGPKQEWNRPFFEVYEDGAGEFRWRLVATNGRILADSGEGYTRRRDARRAVRMVKRAAVLDGVQSR